MINTNYPKIYKTCSQIPLILRYYNYRNCKRKEIRGESVIRAKWLVVSMLVLFMCLFTSREYAISKAEASESKWTVTYYSKLNFTGSTVQKKADRINYSWGTSNPVKGIPQNRFSAKMTKTISVSSGGAYRISGKANDGVRVYIDGKKKVDDWKSGTHTFSKDVMLSKGEHKIEVHYYDQTGTAYITVDVNKVAAKISTEQWTGLFFPSKNFTGTPVSTSVKSLNASWGSKAPHTKIPAGTYSAVYQKKVVVAKETKYILMGKANDGIRIYVDGKKQVDEWKPGTRNFEKNITLKKGTHTIKVQYYNESGSARLQADLKEASTVTPLGKWDVTFYDQKELKGKRVKQTASKLNYKWGTASPASGIPSNGFSAKFVKRTNLSGGTYIISGGANDGIRVYVNGKKQIDYWKNGMYTFNQEIKLDPGIAIIEVRYYENTGDARIQVNVTKKSKKKSVAYSKHDITLDTALTKQMATSPQTDKKYGAYIPKSSVKLASTGTSGKTVDKVEIITTSSRLLGNLKANANVTIQGEKSFNDTDYYKILTSWVNASKTDTKYYLNPDSFTNQNEKEYYQYVKLSAFSALNEDELNNKILYNKGILKNRADAYLKAGFKYDVNEIYLISHSSLETGNGMSRLATGVKVKTKKDSQGNIVYNKNGEKEIVVLDNDAKSYEAKVYNMYGIGAYDDCALECGARRAFNEGWTTADKAIIEGAKFAAENYIYAGQDTLYEMRWNPEALVTRGIPYHQYATDIGWAVKQTRSFEQLYSLLDSYTVEYDVPRYN